MSLNWDAFIIFLKLESMQNYQNQEANNFVIFMHVWETCVWKLYTSCLDIYNVIEEYAMIAVFRLNAVD